MSEQVLADYGRAYGLASVALRYFNAAGADPDGEIGEDHEPETHLIPLVIQAALGLRDRVEIYGDDYETPDGTCIRDYVHVSDIAEAHVLALKSLEQSQGFTAYNLGNGLGFSVKEVIDTAARIAGRAVPAAMSPRRPGDPACLVGDAQRIRRDLGWKTRFPDLETIIGTAWRWHRSQVERPEER
jgi:UDP-glucose-4-epimerase GalE